MSRGPFLISTEPPGERQLGLARVVVGVLFVAFLVTVAFRDTQLARLDAFVPVANAVTGLNDLVTALLLYAQFSLTRIRALLVLASGFLFKSLILVPHALTFPGVLAPNGLLGPQLQTTAWLIPTQHLGFALCAIAYAVLRDRDHGTPSAGQARLTPIAVAATATVALAVFVTWLLIVEASHLPRLIAADAVHVSDAFQHVVAPLFLAMILGSVVVLRRRPKSMIDLWLRVAIWAWVFEALLSTISLARFSLVFYVVKGMGVVSSAFVLLALLSESLMLHRRLVLATAARERDREEHRTAMDVLVESLAHELRQPLTAIFLNGQAGAAMVAAASTDLDEIGATLKDMSASAHRANAIIDSVRTVFAHSPRDQNMLEANDLVRETVDIMRHELEAHYVVLDLELVPSLPSIRGHHGQLTQVLMNGVKNAVESLATISERARQLCIRTTPLGPDRVAICIEDCGRGLDPVARDRVFEPFVSTKSGGMGLGLSICKSIIEAHEGTLSLVPRSPHGAVFQVELPVGNRADLAPVVRPGAGAMGSSSPTATAQPTRTSTIAPSSLGRGVPR